ncbi:hypothetical protein BP00DRAFT_427457 [Aspergillus indologenus CBS 114.80]|uniref:Uncharacterized protein n=1 Tax=Aspergillus indologenus CBS 114.80 TaxID=1450541 RepID=A0A2V5J5I3_9EURO|nr:hypothetical protein BP00DRAFT_427457 [Aspergillus indologenus CBS 114.80]
MIKTHASSSGCKDQTLANNTEQEAVKRPLRHRLLTARQTCNAAPETCQPRGAATATWESWTLTGWLWGIMSPSVNSGRLSTNALSGCCCCCCCFHPPAYAHWET